MEEVTLTPSEATVLSLVGRGHGAREIAERLCVSVPTIRKHLQACKAKTGARNLTQAWCRAFDEKGRGD